jgi:hypothetical protein
MRNVMPHLTCEAKGEKMSLYNMMNGVTAATFFILPMLGKHPDEYPRFRDCFTADQEHPEYQDHIMVYTRVGGGNREDYIDEIEALQNLPGYIADFDDSFDCTFATFVFQVPEEIKEDYAKITSGKLVEISGSYKKRLYDVFPKLKEKFDELFSTEA